VPQFSPPLPADERRRAHATTAAFLFQWWQSVLAWLELRDDETLYIESSEDFEKVTSEQGPTFQVKASNRAPLTLRSVEVIDALNHFWSVSQHDSRKIRFVLLTQATAGTEQRPGVGEAISGVELWMSVGLTHSLEAADQLRRFLRDDERISPKLLPELHQFLREASADELRDRLIEPVVFDFGRDGTEVVRQLVKDRLVVLVHERHNASVIEAERAAETIFLKVLEAAASRERMPLNRAQLLRLLEAEIIGYRRTVGLAISATPHVTTSSHEGSLWNPLSDELALPPLPTRILTRTTLVEKTCKQLHDAQALILTGSTGSGKTTLAKLVAKDRGGDWWWVDLQDVSAEMAHLAFRRILGIADRFRGTVLNVVIDAFATDNLPEAALNTFRALAWLVRKRGGKMVVTTQRNLTATEQASFGWTDSIVVGVPSMEQAEIAQMLRELGCVDTQLVELWSLAVHLHTQGHPQLAHAACLSLQRQGWPQFNAETFQASSDSLEAERSRARRLVAKLANEDLELLTRLGVLGGTFRRDHALNVADKLDRVPAAGFRFDELLGPWIEPADVIGYHRLSPLLSDITALVSPNRRIEIERACALARLEATPVYFQDVGHALRHAFAARARDLIAKIVAKALQTPEKHRTYAFTQLLWITWLSESDLELAVSGHKPTAQIIHLLRFEIVVRVLPAQAAKYLELCERHMIGDAQHIALQRFAMITEMLIHSTKHLAAEDVVFYMEKAAELSFAVSDDFRRVVRFPRVMLPPALRSVPEDENIRLSLAGFVLNQVEGQAFVGGLMNALVKLPEERRGAIVRAFTAWPCLFALLIDKIWLKEADQPSPNWDQLLGWFTAMKDQAAEWNAGGLVVAFARAASVVCNEYLDDAVRASSFLANSATADPGWESLLLEQHAKIAGRKKEDAEALMFMRRALPNWEKTDFGVHPKLLAFQRAGTWAGKTEHWRESAGYFFEGAKLARKLKLVVQEAGLITDAGVSLWRAGDKRAAIAAFAETIDLCSKMGPPREDLATYQFQKLLGHILLEFTLGPRRSEHQAVRAQAPVVSGMASEPTLNENVKALPPPRLGACKTFVAMLENDYLGEDIQWKRFEHELLESRSLSTRAFSIELAIRKAVRRADLASLPSLASRRASVEAVGRLAAANSKEIEQFEMNENVDFPKVQCGFDEPGCGERLFWAACLGAATRGVEIGKGLHELEERLAESPFPDALGEWVRRGLGIAGAADSDIELIVRSAENVSDRVLASAVFIGRPRPAPEVLWVALYLALTALSENYWGGDVLRMLDEYAGRSWRAAAENRFAFRNPTLWLPDLKALCGEPVTGARRLAALLLASVHALDLRPDNRILEQLTGIRDGTVVSPLHRLAPGFA